MYACAHPRFGGGGSIRQAEPARLRSVPRAIGPGRGQRL